MLLTLIPGILSFFASFLPKVFDFFQDKQDKAHELAIMQLQLQVSKDTNAEKLAEVNVGADVTLSQAAHTPQVLTNIWFVDFLNGIIRPSIAIGFFFLFCAVKVASYVTLYHAGPGTAWNTVLPLLWQDTDMAIFGSIMGFFFGSRAVLKMGSR